MTRINKKTLLLASLVGLALAGCTNRLADVTYISTKAVNQEQLSTATTDNIRSTGEDMKQIIIFIPTGQPDIKEAIDQAIETRPCGIALKDATLTAYSWYIPWVYGQHKLIAEGKVLEDVNCVAQQPLTNSTGINTSSKVEASLN